MAQVKRETMDNDAQHIAFRAASHPPTMSARSAPSVSQDTPPGSSSASAVDTQDTEMTSDGHDQTSAAGPEGLTALGHESRALIKTIQKLDALGINATLPSLPRIVVVGDQSSGKSSIIEAVCDIALPRSSGTCTRCPYRLTTTQAKPGQPWSCKVSLLQQYAYHPQSRVASGSAYDCWADQNLVTCPFVLVTDKAELDTCLRRAQLAILNPRRNPAEFVNVDLDQRCGTQVGFSPNTIGLEIAGHDLPELSLFDLPGAINACVESESEENENQVIDFVERLIKTYAREPKTIILFCCASSQETETTTTIKFIKQCNATSRTVGVMTKADLLPLHLVPSLHKHFQADPFKLGQGWFMTKQLSQDQINNGVTHDEAMAEETRFFSGDPWSTSLAAFANRFGVEHLRVALSHRLTAFIRGEMPNIAKRVEDRLSAVDNKLASFPIRAAAPGLAVVTEIDHIKDALHRQIQAQSVDSALRVQFRELLCEMREQLKKSAPSALLSTPGYTKPDYTINVDDSDEAEESPLKKRKANGGSVFGTPSRSQSRMPPTPGSRRAAQPQGQGQPGRVTFRLDDVRNMNERCPSADMPGQISDYVCRELAKQTLFAWNAIIDNFIRKFRVIFANMLADCVADTFMQRRSTKLYTETGKILDALFSELMKAGEDRIRHMVACETHRPLTYAEELMRSKVESLTPKLMSKRLEHRGKEYFEDQEARTNKIIALNDRTKKLADQNWVKMNLESDKYDREMKALAWPMAYYAIASVALLDNMAKELEFGMFYHFESRVRTVLYESLRPMDANFCAELLAEHPQRELQRTRLLEEKQKLQEASLELAAVSDVRVA